MKKRKELVEEIEKVKEPVEETVAEVKEAPDYCILGTNETLEDVAKKYGLSVADLQGLNNNATIMPGNQVRVR